MSKRRINNLLSRDDIGGRELGKILITSLVNDLNQLGEENKKRLFEDEEFIKAEQSLTSPLQWRIYSTYKALYNGITDAFNYMQAMRQQFLNGFNELAWQIDRMQRAEQLLTFSYYQTPLILTQKQYDDLKSDVEKNMGKFKESYAELLFETLDAFISDEKQAPKDLVAEFEKAKKIIIKDKELEKQYINAYELGYYTLPDGRRNDEMSKAEWQEALEEEYLKTHSLTINGEPQGYTETLKRYSIDSKTKGYKLFYLGAEETRKELEAIAKTKIEATDEEIMDTLYWAINDSLNQHNKLEKLMADLLDMSNSTTWHLYEEPPEPITLMDLLIFCVDEGMGAEKEKQRKIINLLKKEAPGIFQIVNDYIEQHIDKAKGLKATQYYKDLITHDELTKIGYIGYENATKASNRTIIEAIIENKAYEGTQALKVAKTIGFNKDIAILVNPDSNVLDSKGNYLYGKSVETYLESLGDTTQEQIENISVAKEILIAPALKRIYAYNELIKIISDVFGVENLKEPATMDISDLETRIRAYNNLIYTLYYIVGGDEKRKTEKRSFIKLAFIPIDYEALKPTKQAIEEVTAELDGLEHVVETFKKLKYLDDYINKLATIGKDEGANNEKY